jgi:peptide/nickel transport system substrate-binding protein
MRPAQQVLPPGMPGYRRFEPYPHDLAVARQLIAEADPEDRDITVWSDNTPPNDEAGEYLEGVLAELGFHPTLKLIEPSSYFTVIGNGATPDLDIGWGNWLLDYPHPNDYFQPQLSSESIATTNSTNWARFADPRIDAEIKRLGAQRLGPAQLRRYAALDRQVMARAPWAPFGNLKLATFVSSAIDLQKVTFSPIFGQDLTSFEFR